MIPKYRLFKLVLWNELWVAYWWYDFEVKRLKLKFKVRVRIANAY